MKLFRKKRKAESLWISWILLTAFTVAIGAFVFHWMTIYTEDRSAELQKSADRERLCNSIAIRVDSICQSSQLIMVNVSNTKTVDVAQLSFRMIDSFDNVRTIKKDAKIGPNEIMNFKILKDGITQQMDITPAVSIDSEMVICENQKIFYEDISFC